MIWGKAIGLLEEEMGGVIFCDKVCQGVGGLLVSSPVMSKSFLVDETPKGFMTIHLFFEDFSLRK